MTRQMTQMLPPPEKHELELEVDGLFVNGDKKHVAQYVQRDSTLVSKWLSPNKGDKNNVVYFFILFLWAFDCIRRDLGDAVISIVLRERAKWLAEAPVMAQNPAKLTKRVGSELFEAIESELKGEPVDKQIKEFTDVKNAIAGKLEDLERRRNANFGGPVSLGTRTVVHGIMEDRVS